MVRIGNAGQGQRGAGDAHEAEQNHQVQDQRQVGVDARAPVVNKHEGHDHEHAHDGRRHALLNGIGAQRRAHKTLLELFERGRKRAGAQQLRQRGNLIWREAAPDLARVADRALDGGHLADLVVHDHGHSLAHVLAGVVVEAVAGFISQRKADIPLPGVGIRTRIGGAEVVSRHYRFPLQHIYALRFLGAGTALHPGKGLQLLVGWNAASLAGRRILFVLVRTAGHGVNLKPVRALDNGLDLAFVFHSRQVHQNLVVAQAVL